jgi:hypothetical protein
MMLFVRRLRSFKGVNPFQAGFVRASRTVDHVFIIYVLSCMATFSNRPLFLVFIDVESCFPSILGTLMLLAWYSFGVGGSWCRVLWAAMVAGRAVLTLRGIRHCWIANKGGVPQGGVHGPQAHNVFANDGPLAVGIGRDSSDDLPRLGQYVISALDFADDRVLPGFSHAAVQVSLDRAAGKYKLDFLSINAKKTVAMIIDPSGTMQYTDRARFYTRSDQPGEFTLLINGEPITFVDNFRYLGILLNKNGDWQSSAEAIFSSGTGKMWAVLSKIKSLFTLPLAFALMLYRSIVQGSLT